MDENKYWDIRDKIVNEVDTENTIKLVLELLENLKEDREEKLTEEQRNDLAFQLNEILRDW